MLVINKESLLTAIVAFLEAVDRDTTMSYLKLQKDGSCYVTGLDETANDDSTIQKCPGKGAKALKEGWHLTDQGDSAVYMVFRAIMNQLQIAGFPIDLQSPDRDRKGKVLDEQVKPLIHQLHTICYENKIAHLCIFAVSDEETVSSYNLGPHTDPPKLLKVLNDVIELSVRD